MESCFATSSLNPTLTEQAVTKGLSNNRGFDFYPPLKRTKTNQEQYELFYGRC